MTDKNDQKIVSEGVDQCLRDRLGISLEEASNRNLRLEISKALTAFYAFDIARYRDDFDSDEIDQGLECDGKGDVAVDFVVARDDIYFIYQTKYRSGKANLTRDEISGFFAIHNRILSTSGMQNANESVKSQLEGVSDSSGFRFFLIVNFRVSDEMRAEFNAWRERARATAGDADVDWLLKDIGQIAKEYRQAGTADGKAPDVEIPLVSLPQIVDEKTGDQPFIDMSSHLSDKKYRTIVTVIQGTTLRDLFVKNAPALFDNNIREYLGSTKSINKKIRDTITKEPERFFLFNNGISAICTEMKIKATPEGGKRLACRNFQIINGAQTVSTIGDSQSPNLDKVWVLLRITKGEAVKTTEEGLNRQIVEFNNSQTAIRFSDFRSNDEVQKTLERKFGEFLYRAEVPTGKKMAYLRKRRMIRKKQNTVSIDLEKLAKALYAFDEKSEPARLYSVSSFLFDPSESGMYNRLFGSYSVTPAGIRKTIAVAILIVFLESHLKKCMKELRDQKKGDEKKIEQKRMDNVGYMVNSLKWHILHSLGHVAREIYPRKEKAVIDGILDGTAFRKKGFVTVCLGVIKERIHTILVMQPTIDGALNFKRWMRSDEGVRQIRGVLEALRHNKPEINWNE